MPTTTCSTCGATRASRVLRSGRTLVEPCTCGPDKPVGHFAIVRGQLRGPFPHPPTARDIAATLRSDSPGE